MVTEPAISSFAEITRRVIAEDGLAEHLPTVLYPARKQILVLEGAPTGSLEPVSLEWARANAVGDEEFLLAFRISQTEFKVVWRRGDALESQVFAV